MARPTALQERVETWHRPHAHPVLGLGWKTAMACSLASLALEALNVVVCFFVERGNEGDPCLENFELWELQEGPCWPKRKCPS